jgi:4'-phosphopantetheinyl transferase
MADVEVWRHRHSVGRATADLDLGCLSVDEAERAARFVNERDRRRFVESHAFLRQVLAGYHSCLAADLRFDVDLRGKPRLVTSADEAPAEFNMSHTDTITLVAVSQRGPIGVDVEAIRQFPEWREVARRVLSQNELCMVLDSPPDQQVRSLFRCWTRIEAAVKAFGFGLSDDLPSFDAIPLGVIALNAPSSTTTLLYGAESTVVEFVPDEAHVAALVVAGATHLVQFYEFTGTAGANSWADAISTS